MTFTIEQQIAEVRREIALRKNVYPKWVEHGRLRGDKAKEQIDAMQAVHDTLMHIKEFEDAKAILL